ncbi:hypothetical protein GN956_G25377 [Arapaima gigas]
MPGIFTHSSSVAGGERFFSKRSFGSVQKKGVEVGREGRGVSEGRVTPPVRQRLGGKSRQAATDGSAAVSDKTLCSPEEDNYRGEQPPGGEHLQRVK